MIAVDGMGGDFAPTQILKGVLKAAAQSVPILLFGPEQVLDKELTRLDVNWRRLPITLSHATDIIGMAEDPVKAVRNKSQSSLVLAVKSCKQGDASAIVSAGSTGAFIASVILILERQQSIERPAIAGYLPGLRGNVVVLDLGANADCRAHNLVKFAHLGHEHADSVLGITNPRIGLLSLGHESSKGSLLIKKTHNLLKESDLNFIGNIEPLDLINNQADVVVTDGFVGNVLLKTIEATAHMFIKLIDSKLDDKFDLSDTNQSIIASVKAVMHKLDELRLNGAFLLGIKTTAVVLHGSAQEKAVENGILTAYNAVQRKKRKE